MDGLPGLFHASLPHAPEIGAEHVLQHRPLQRALECTRRTIDEVINDPFARNQVAGFYKLHCWVERETERSELERQWAMPSRVRGR